MIQPLSVRVCVHVCLCRIYGGCVCGSTSLCGRPTSQLPVRLPHTHIHTHIFYTYPNVLDGLMLLEILAPLPPCLPRITPSATAPSNPNENSCYILNSQEDVGCLAIISSLLSAPYSCVTPRCQIQIHFSEKKVHCKIPMKQENALNPTNMLTVFSFAV